MESKLIPFIFYLMSLFFEYFIKPKHPTIATTATTATIAIVVASPAFNILFAVVFDDWIVFLDVFFVVFTDVFLLLLVAGVVGVVGV